MARAVRWASRRSRGRGDSRPAVSRHAESGWDAKSGTGAAREIGSFRGSAAAGHAAPFRAFRFYGRGGCRCRTGAGALTAQNPLPRLAKSLPGPGLGELLLLEVGHERVAGVILGARDQMAVGPNVRHAEGRPAVQAGGDSGMAGARGTGVRRAVAHDAGQGLTVAVRLCSRTLWCRPERARAMVQGRPPRLAWSRYSTRRARASRKNPGPGPARRARGCANVHWPC